jgi:UDP-N-acetylglucosamine 2-epimerase (non-hydrolysing)
MLEKKPDRLLLLGDTNSALTAIIAKRLGIAVYHMEAGNRCFDDRVPEETNRRIIDHSSDILLPYTEHSRRHLANEGIHASRIFVTGNPIAEVLTAYAPKIAASKAMAQLKLSPQGFFLVTLHRAENVDTPERLEKFLQAFRALHTQYGKPVIISTHPRLRDRLNKQQTSTDKRDGLYFLDPLGFFDFVHLQQQAFCVLSDSGTVQEEAAIFGIPNVTLRDVTERPETVECGSNILSGAEPAMIALAVKVALEGAGKALPPQDYTKANVSDTVVRILLNYRG